MKEHEGISIEAALAAENPPSEWAECLIGYAILAALIAMKFLL